MPGAMAAAAMSNVYVLTKLFNNTHLLVSESNCV